MRQPKIHGELARLAVAAVHQAAEHVQVHDDEEHRRAGRVHVADEPAPRDVAHDVLDRLERLRRVGLVVHREEDAGDDLHHQHERGERAEVVPEVEVLRRDVLAPLRFPQRGQRKARVDPGQELLHGRGSLTPTCRRFADHDLGVGQVLVRRDREVGRRRHALVDAAGEVELRSDGTGRRSRRASRDRGPPARSRAGTSASSRGACRCRRRRTSLSLIERCSFLQYAGCCETLEFGSASLRSSFGSDVEHRLACD